MWQHYWFRGITIVPAEVKNIGILIIQTVWNWALHAVSITTVFIIPAYVAHREIQAGTAATIACNAVLSSWPGETIITRICLGAVVGTKVT